MFLPWRKNDQDALPKLRRKLTRDLSLPGLPREKVLAAVAALLDAGDDGINLGVQGGQYRFVIGPDVEAEMERTRYNCHTVLCRIGMESADRAGHRDAFGVVFLPQPIERHGELRAGHGGVAAEAPGQADMVVAALDAGVRVAEIAGDASADGNRLAGLDEAGRLLNVQFQIGAQVRGIEMTDAGA